MPAVVVVAAVETIHLQRPEALAELVEIPPAATAETL
jgi:hypothetical protein